MTVVLTLLGMFSNPLLLSKDALKLTLLFAVAFNPSAPIIAS